METFKTQKMAQRRATSCSAVFQVFKLRAKEAASPPDRDFVFLCVAHQLENGSVEVFRGRRDRNVDRAEAHTVDFIERDAGETVERGLRGLHWRVAFAYLEGTLRQD